MFVHLADKIYNTNSETVRGTDWNDIIISEVTSASIQGYGGNDQITNIADGNFTANGGEGNDIIINYAQSGDSTLNGEWGDDFLISYVTNSLDVQLSGGYGNDTLMNCGTGVDVFKIYSTNCGLDVISNCSSDDLIYFDGSLSECSFQVVGADIVVNSVRLSTGNYQGSTLIIQGGANQRLNFFTEYNQHDFEQVIDNYKEIFADYAASLEDDVSADEINFYDATLSDIVSTSVGDNSIAITLNTGEVAQVASTGNVSPKFKLSSGKSYVYNRTTDSWQQS